MRGTQVLGPRGTPGPLRSSDRSRPGPGAELPQGGGAPAPGTRSPQTPLSRDPRGFPDKPGPRRAPSRRSPPLPAPGPSALGGTFSFFVAISTLPMAASDSKSASLRSFPGILRHERCRQADLVHRVERKRQPEPVGPPSCRHFRWRSVSPGRRTRSRKQ